MAINIIGSNYSGEVLEHVLVRATTGNQIVKDKHINLIPNVQDKESIPVIRASDMLQKRKEQPVSADSKGDFDYDEVVLEPKEFMVYTEFNPRKFERIWRKFQPKGPLVFSELNPYVQRLLLDQLLKVVQSQVGKEYIVGQHGAGATEFFDGLVTRIRANGDVQKVSGAAALDESNIIDAMLESEKLIPDEIRDHPDMKLFISRKDFRKYDTVITNSTKGVGWDKITKAAFKDMRVVPLIGLPENCMFNAVANNGLDSNFWGGVGYVQDANAVQVDKVTNAGERYFFKMLMKADTQIAFGEDIVLYDYTGA